MNCDMHVCLRGTMKISRWAGVFPVEGLDKANIEGLRFNIKSFYTLYYLWTIFLLTSMAFVVTRWFFTSDINLNSFSVLAFYVSGVAAAILLLKLASEWPRLMCRVAKIERCVVAIRVSKTKAAKIIVITYVVLIFAVFEHLLNLVFRVKNVLLCPHEEDKYSSNIWEIYLSRMFPHIFQSVPVNFVTITICILGNLQATFLWNFTDLMIISFSVYLKSYFKDFNILVNSQSDKKTQDWEQLRIYYSKLVALVQAVDSKMSYLILISVLSNLFFICLQLYMTLNYGYILIMNCPELQQDKRNIDRYINLFYYSFSFTFLVTRATTMLFLAANVNTAAVEPKDALSCVSHTEYNIHVQRFNRQLRYTTTALSGVFFNVTRGMILKVFATMLTYEMVMLQFNK